MFNTSAINAAITLCFTSADIAIDARKAYQSLVVELQDLLKGADRETIKGYVCPVAAKHYGETYADGKWGDSKCAAKRYANRVIADVLVGASSPASSDKTINPAIELPEGVVEAIQAAMAGLTKPECAAACKQALEGLSFE
jgi:hypothetical protein